MSNSINFSVRPQGHFTISTNLRGKITEFSNLILNSGLNLIATSYPYIDHCFVGMGNTPPTVDDTNLVSFVQSTNYKTSQVDGVASSAPYYSYRRTVFRFHAGTVTGNLSEIGVGIIYGNVRRLFCRALIKDSFGNPTTITLLPDEVLEVTYELRHYMPTVDTTGTITLAGNIGGVYEYTLRPAKVTTHSIFAQDGWSANVTYTYHEYRHTHARAGGIGTITGEPAGTNYSATSSSAKEYLVDTHSTEITYTFGVDQGNVPGGIKSITFIMGTGLYQVEFTPAIPKSNMDSLSLTFSNSWARRP